MIVSNEVKEVISPGDKTIRVEKCRIAGDGLIQQIDRWQQNCLAVVNALLHKKAFGSRPGFMAVGGYDGIRLIYEALKKTGGKTDGDALIEAMKGMKWESPRGPISIDPETRDIVQNIYIRKVEKVDGELYNVEFATFEAVKDSGKTKK